MIVCKVWRGQISVVEACERRGGWGEGVGRRGAAMPKT
eukprot:COSAG06_NODE_71355_length_185_cov_17.674419_1_plen_37_part_10